MKNTILCLFFFLLLGQTNFVYGQSYTTQQERLPCVNKKFTIVAHIFKDSLGNYGVTEMAITTALTEVNKFFAPIRVSFEVCEFRYHENFQHDNEDQGTELAEMYVKYHADFRINMYFINSLDGPACGLAALGGVGSAFTGGVFIEKPMCTNAPVIAHELGHFFGLLHTFEGGGTELVDGSNCTTAGDFLCDTPADPYVPFNPIEGYVSTGCRFINQQTDANGEYYNPDVGNIMSYYHCGDCGFTWGQLNKMAQTYLSAAIKLW